MTAAVAGVASVVAALCAVVPAVGTLPVPSTALPRLVADLGFGLGQATSLQLALPAAAVAAAVSGPAVRALAGWPVLLAGGIVLATGDLLVGAAADAAAFRTTRLVQGAGAGMVLVGALAVAAAPGRSPRARRMLAGVWAAVVLGALALVPLEQVRLASDGFREPFRPLWPLLAAGAAAAMVALLTGAARPDRAAPDRAAPDPAGAGVDAGPGTGELARSRALLAVPGVLAAAFVAYRLIPGRLSSSLTPLVPLLAVLAVLASLGLLARTCRPPGGVAALAVAGPVGAGLLPLLLVAPGILGLTARRSTLASARVAVGPAVAAAVAAAVAGVAGAALARRWPGLPAGAGALVAAAGAFAVLPVSPGGGGLPLVPAMVLLGGGGGLAVGAAVGGGPRPGRDDAGLGVAALVAGLAVGTTIVAVLSARGSDRALRDVRGRLDQGPAVVGEAVRSGALDGARQAARFGAGLLALSGFAAVVEALRPREEPTVPARAPDPGTQEGGGGR